MKARCPYCGAEIDLSEIFREGDLHAVIRLLPSFGQHHRLIWEYVELFGITPISRHASKMRRLLEELGRLWEAEGFNFNRQIYSISKAGIAEALRECVNRAGLKPKNHNYLKQVMVTIAEREEKERSIQAERDLRDKEKQLMQGEVLPDSSDYEIPEDIRERVRNIGQGKFKS
jgi:hypothetical protein